jgi:hypothetical protein
MYETLIDPPNEFAPKELPPLMLKALQFENAKSLTCTDTPLADVSPHLLLLLLLELKLQEYAPTYNTLIDPPYEFTPKVLAPRLMLEAVQFQHTDSLTCTDTPLAWVASQLLLVIPILGAALLKLHAYAPTYNTLIDPPYEFPPKVLAPRLILEALQFRHTELLTCTDTPLAVVASHLLLLLLDAALLKLHEYAPTYNTLVDPPYEFTA